MLAAMNTRASDRPDPATLKLIHEEARRILDRQADEIDALNARAQQVVAFGSIFVGLIVALRPMRGGAVLTILFAGGLCVFGLAAGAAVAASWIVGWRRASRPRRLWVRYRLWPDDWLREQLIVNLIDSHEANERSILAKLRYMRSAQIFLALEILYLVGVLIARPYL
jgi:hypothetical protein